MKLPLLLVLAAGMAVTPAVLSAATFEGKVRMKVTDSRGNAHEMDYRMKEGFIRTDIETGKGESASVIMDLGKQEMTILIPQQHMYMVRPLTDVNAAVERAQNDQGNSFEKTGETTTILGYTCTKYVAKSKDSTSDIWVTDQLGRFMGLGGQNPMGGMGGMGGRHAAHGGSGWEQALMGKDFFPLRVVSHKGNGKEEFRMEATSIEKESEPASVFAPPEGYQKLDLGGMMQGLGLHR